MPQPMPDEGQVACPVGLEVEMVMSLTEELYDFLRNGDEHSRKPEDLGLKMELGCEEHKFIAEELAGWLERNKLVITANSYDVSEYYDLT